MATSSLDPAPPADVASVGGRQVALPAPVQHDDIGAAQQQDPLCQKLFPLATSPGAQWLIPWRAATLAFSINEQVLCVGVKNGPTRAAPLKLFIGALFTLITLATRAVIRHRQDLPAPGGVILVAFSSSRHTGPQFTAELFKQLCERLGVPKIYASLYSPCEKSIAEAYMRSLKSALRMCLHYFRKQCGCGSTRIRLCPSCYA
ncbi:hypothetical protein Efla_003390 [Eimeria flavescens]